PGQAGQLHRCLRLAVVRADLLGAGLAGGQGLVGAGGADDDPPPARPTGFADVLATAGAQADALHAGVNVARGLALAGAAREAGGGLVERVVTGGTAGPGPLAIVGDGVVTMGTACHDRSALDVLADDHDRHAQAPDNPDGRGAGSAGGQAPTVELR